MAEGGMFTASRPTQITLGESGAEGAFMFPLNRGGKDLDRVFGNLAGQVRGSGGESRNTMGEDRK